MADAGVLCNQLLKLRVSAIPGAAVQEGKESQDAFMASLTSKQDSKSLMPADSAFRMLSSVPEPSPEGVTRPVSWSALG